MSNNMQIVVDKLIKREKSMSIIDCSMGGVFINAITNVVKANEVLKFGGVIYSYDFLMKIGVSKEIINKYSFCSMNVAKEVSKNISDFSDSNYGIGITGMMGDLIYVSVYDRDNDKYYTLSMDISEEELEIGKRMVVNGITMLLLTVI